VSSSSAAAEPVVDLKPIASAPVAVRTSVQEGTQTPRERARRGPDVTSTSGPMTLSLRISQDQHESAFTEQHQSASAGRMTIGDRGNA
jgi:hypothetical protein